MMIGKMTFISVLTEGLNTIIPLNDEETEMCYESIREYLQDNFTSLAANFEAGEDEAGNVYYDIIILNSLSEEPVFSVRSQDARMYILKEGDLLDSEIAAALYGIIMLLSTLLIVRLNNFVFHSHDTPVVFDEKGNPILGNAVFEDEEYEYDNEEKDSNEITSEKVKDKKTKEDKKDKENKEAEESEEEASSFDDEFI